MLLRVLKSFIGYFPKLKNRSRSLDSYWLQKIPIARIKDRMELLNEICLGKKVIHFGCTDYPLFSPETNLHLKLSKICAELHGFDIDINGIDVLKSFYDSKYFSSFDEIGNEDYDICLVPETIEHVGDVQLFLKKIDSLNCAKFFISAPNCFNDFFKHHYNNDKRVFIEGIHPDHNCWYSPFTLQNIINKYTKLKIEKMYLSNNDLMVIAICYKEDLL